MEKLLTLLLHLTEKVPYLSEIEREAEMDLLRGVEKDLGLEGIVPPAQGPTNAPAPEPPDVPVPGPVAEPVPPDEQPPPPTGMPGATTEEIAPEESNTFAGVTPPPAGEPPVTHEEGAPAPAPAEPAVTTEAAPASSGFTPEQRAELEAMMRGGLPPA